MDVKLGLAFNIEGVCLRRTRLTQLALPDVTALPLRRPLFSAHSQRIMSTESQYQKESLGSKLKHLLPGHSKDEAHGDRTDPTIAHEQVKSARAEHELREAEADRQIGQYSLFSSATLLDCTDAPRTRQRSAKHSRRSSPLRTPETLRRPSSCSLVDLFPPFLPELRSTTRRTAERGQRCPTSRGVPTSPRRSCIRGIMRVGIRP